MQRLGNPDESQWRCQILPNRTILSASQASNSGVILKLCDSHDRRRQAEEELEVDYVFAATGYVRNAHESMLSEVEDLLPEGLQKIGRFPVARDYRVQFSRDKVDEKAGVWLQGSNEGTHGVRFSPIPRAEFEDGPLTTST